MAEPVAGISTERPRPPVAGTNTERPRSSVAGSSTDRPRSPVAGSSTERPRSPVAGPSTDRPQLQPKVRPFQKSRKEYIIEVTDEEEKPMVKSKEAEELDRLRKEADRRKTRQLMRQTIRMVLAENRQTDYNRGRGYFRGRGYWRGRGYGYRKESRVQWSPSHSPCSCTRQSCKHQFCTRQSCTRQSCACQSCTRCSDCSCNVHH